MIWIVIVKEKVFFKFCCLFLFFLTKNLFAATFGSDYTIQDHYYFPFEVDNKIANDAVMDNGFTLTNKEGQEVYATCSWDSFFPVSGLINLNGGSLYLNRDIDIKEVSSLGSAGKIYGNGYSINFPSSDNIWGIPSSVDRTGILNLLVNKSENSAVVQVDWSYDGKYLLVGKDYPSGGFRAIKVFYFDGTSISLGAAYDSALGNRRVAKWHPCSYYFISNHFLDTLSTVTRLFYFNSVTNNISVKDTLNFDANAVAWSKFGNYVALLHDHSMEVYFFSEISEDLTLIDNFDFSGYGTGQDRSLDWSLDGKYIVFGTDSTINANLFIVGFDGANLNITTSEHIPAATVFSVNWNKDNLLAVGLGGTSNNVKIYSFINDSVNELYSEPETTGYRCVSWDKSGKRLFAGKRNSGGDDFKCYYWNENDHSLIFLQSEEFDAIINTIAISPSSKYIAIGSDSNDFFNIYDFNQNEFLFDNTNLILNSESEFIVTTTFSGQCSINGNGNRLHLSENGIIKVGSNSQLKLQNLNLVGLSENNMQCLADNASIIIQDCKLTLSNNYIFGAGSILFQGDNIVSGTCKFTYATSCGSTIDKNSLLYFDQGTTFSYAPALANRDLIYMEDKSSGIYFNGSSVNSTKTGLRLTKGRIFIENLVNFNSEGNSTSEAICLGNGLSSDDVGLEVLSGAYLEISGRVDYQNTN